MGVFDTSCNSPPLGCTMVAMSKLDKHTNRIEERSNLLEVDGVEFRALCLYQSSAPLRVHVYDSLSLNSKWR